MPTPRKVRIGDVLIQANLITQEQLDQALVAQKEQGGKLGDVVIQLGLVSETDLLQALANLLKIPFIELDQYKVKPDILRKLPERLARRFRVIILDEIGDQYLIGMADPTDVLAYDEITQTLDSQLRIAIVRESELMRIVDQVYRRTEDIASFAAELKEELGKETDEIKIEDDEASLGDEEAPVAKLLESIFEDAVQINASDIHIEPDHGMLRIRQRIDGVLQESIIEGTAINAAIALRIKLIAKLNISEKRLPQDGRFNIKVKGRSIDVRVATMPTQHGESVVMRLLDQSRGILKLDDLGMDDDSLRRFRFNINRPNGLVLVTGPTGSGKTTTLYAALSELNVITKKLITIEDPVEYRLPRVQQTQVRANIDLTFARILRTVLRLDPDIVMVGEMRDEETARIGLRAAMTGHMVFSTLHTNDAISSAMRLLDMGAEGFLVAGALRLIVAQRLVRKICDSCRHEFQPTDDQLTWIELLMGRVDKTWKFYAGKGCSQCNHIGYAGRMAVHEMLEIDARLADALRTGDSGKFASAAANKKGFIPLAVSAFELALHGKTTLEEVFRIATDIEDVRRRNIKSSGGEVDVTGISV